MLEPVLSFLAVRPGQRVVDATVGTGGHAERIARILGENGELIVLDRDAEMLERAAKRLGTLPCPIRPVHGRFSRLGEVLRGLGVGTVDGILLDLGLCSAQLDDAGRGFSFRASPDPGAAGGGRPLDMRMDRSAGRTASDWLEEVDEQTLLDALRAGEVPRARAVAKAIRSRLPIRSTAELVRAVCAVRIPDRNHHPATLVFQAIRMAINDERRELETVLEQIPDLLEPGGRVVVLSYHSGEDRRVKEFLAREARGCICPPDLPVCGCGRVSRIRVLVRGERSDPDEVAKNPRSRSARLRAGQRL